ncbi:hypothetical protein CAK78_15310 [Aeromonas sp. A35_P]|nr:hypothetical protein CAK78_15310 [Aeromonas sp. A35_P]
MTGSVTPLALRHGYTVAIFGWLDSSYAESNEPFLATFSPRGEGLSALARFFAHKADGEAKSIKLNGSPVRECG